MRLDLVGDELDQIDSIWGRTRHGAKPAAATFSLDIILFLVKHLCAVVKTLLKKFDDANGQDFRTRLIVDKSSFS